MKINKLLLAITILLLASVLLTACGNDESTPTPTPTPTSTATPTATATATPTPKPSPEKTLTLGGVPGTSSAHIFFTTLGQVLNDALPEIYFVVKDTLGSQAVMVGLINNGIDTTPTPSPVTPEPTSTPSDTTTPAPTPESTATPAPTPAPIKYDFGQSLASVEFMAYSGMSPWATTNPDLRQLCSWSTQTLIIAVSEASGIQSLADLKDKKLRVGPSGTLPEVTTSQILGTLLIEPSYDKNVLGNLTTDLKNGTIAGFAMYVQQGVPDTTITTVQQDVPLKILSFSPDDIQKVTAKYSYMTTGKIEAGAYQNAEEIDSFTIVATLATLKDSLSETEAYRIVKAIWEGKDTLGNAYPSFKDYKLPEETIASSLIPLHAGALKYFKELGLTVPDTLVPPEANQ